jgi:hypothetical protein
VTEHGEVNEGSEAASLKNQLNLPVCPGVGEDLVLKSTFKNVFFPNRISLKGLKRVIL